MNDSVLIVDDLLTSGGLCRKPLWFGILYFFSPIDFRNMNSWDFCFLRKEYMYLWDWFVADHAWFLFMEISVFFQKFNQIVLL